ncbi:hypothetical protein BC939DRAFT_189816 [Gamsiella multidivaricata]|uniref:uncharacterized protein n=1 Tax=Gamsiella multidivaricata TaxID=101098 RepID=UPI00221E3A83|nr:uncharacterized protein BC939DRAFT_189816 [Gamsiella multidivaricata]KAI7831580.1 hypothetical protein BC939DRAFT_189816 [Gamsiella multidivaricata]
MPASLTRNPSPPSLVEDSIFTKHLDDPHASPVSRLPSANDLVSLAPHTAPTNHTKTSQDVSPPTPAGKLRVAVIGSGLAGLTVAHLLSSLHSDNGHGAVEIEVELFEKAHKLGKEDRRIELR